MIIETSEEMERLGEKLGRKLRGGEVIELIGDVGAGKTTFTHGLAKGLNITDNIVSPSFTINCNYDGRDGLKLRHYDFYRLNDAGIMSMELGEAVSDSRAVTVVEWGDSIKNVLPAKHVVVIINYTANTGRNIKMSTPETLSYLNI